MNNGAHPTFAGILAGICPPVEHLEERHKKASARRFAADPIDLTGFGSLDDDRTDDERARDLRDEADEWKADHVRDMGGAA